MTSNRPAFRFNYDLSMKAGKKEAEILIYSSIVSHKWEKDDPEVTATEFDKMLKEAKASGARKLRLRINSPGGSVWQAVAMKAMLVNAGFEEINIDIEGLCASAATLIACVPGAHVRIADGSEYMIHNPSTWCAGTASDFDRAAERLHNMENDQHVMYAERCRQGPDQIKAWMDEEKWFTASDAVKYGFADEIVKTGSIVAMVSREDMDAMREMYENIPDDIAIMEAEKPTVSNEPEPVASYGPTENTNPEDKEEENTMDGIENMTLEQLRSGNPALYDQIVQIGVTRERERMTEIEELTDEGFEELAREAKNNGTTGAEFLKQVIAERGKRKANYLQQRKKETEPAQSVTGGASDDHDENEADQIDRYAREMAENARSAASEMTGSMY